MRDLSTQELGFVYGAGGKSKCKPPKKSKCKGGSSGSRKHGSRSKGSGSRGSRGRCGKGGSS
jgi:hypothetical protein